eukprot:TRINITY_DN3180_c0_g1_i1.p1 TRINITY_DN3180_c0_g1~~TRINITY_DN3180_c0_g1_i1.p1  ORF type:complete len:192 (+),score=32.31 TRINITY_DN3180_c0_g1_i1:408-983(+)
MIGEDGLKMELEAQGITCLGPEHTGMTYNMQEMAKVKVDPGIEAVVVGMDLGFNMYKLAYALLCLRQIPKCLFISTNRDKTFPASSNVLLPGSGCLAMSLVTCSGREPDVVIGKPEPLFLDIMAQDGVPLDHDRTCMVGDRLDTDIAFGKSRGLATLLVLTGVSTKEDVHAKDNKIHPDYILPSFANIISK